MSRPGKAQAPPGKTGSRGLFPLLFQRILIQRILLHSVDFCRQRRRLLQRQLSLQQRQRTQRIGGQFVILGFMAFNNQHHLAFARVFIFFDPRQQFADRRAVDGSQAVFIT